MVGDPLPEWEEWQVTELDCLSSTTVLVWASKTFDHATLVALWVWGLLARGLVIVGTAGPALCVCSPLCQRRRRSRPVVYAPRGDAERRLAVSREVWQALKGLLVDPTVLLPAYPSAEWRQPAASVTPVMRSVTPEDDGRTVRKSPGGEQRPSRPRCRSASRRLLDNRED